MAEGFFRVKIFIHIHNDACWPLLYHSVLAQAIFMCFLCSLVCWGEVRQISLE